MFTDESIGTWAVRVGMGRAHLIDSIVAFAIVTACGKRMAGDLHGRKLVQVEKPNLRRPYADPNRCDTCIELALRRAAS